MVQRFPPHRPSREPEHHSWLQRESYPHRICLSRKRRDHLACHLSRHLKSTSWRREKTPHHLHPNGLSNKFADLWFHTPTLTRTLTPALLPLPPREAPDLNAKCK